VICCNMLLSLKKVQYEILIVISNLNSWPNQHCVTLTSWFGGGGGGGWGGGIQTNIGNMQCALFRLVWVVVVHA